jgi:hypothetical protein
MREHAELEAELYTTKEITRKEEQKYDRLQTECVMMSREHIANTQRLEEEMERMRQKQKGLEEAVLADEVQGPGN